MCFNTQQITINNFLQNISDEQNRKTIFKGLQSKKKYIPSKFFYDDYGSKLYEEITELPEYYLPNKEITLLKEIASEIKPEIENVDIVELGSGDCTKISIILDFITPQAMKTIRYLPFDVCEPAIKRSSDILSEKFSDIIIYGMVADFQKQLHIIPKDNKRIFCFFGSTLGNLSTDEANEFIINLSNIMQKDDMLILGLDMVKERNILEKAYNDSKNVTAKFNKNILNVVNKYIKTNFKTHDFEHNAFFNEKHSRIEMHLKATKHLQITSPYLQKEININKGETIHTENSHKFTNDHINNLALNANLDIQNIFTDPDKWFSIVQLLK